MQEKDYKNYDYLEVVVKKQNLQEIIDGYTKLLWQKVFEREDRRYNDLVHLCFKREIIVAGKDRLELLEVYYETLLNKRAEIKFNKHSKSKARILLMAVLSFLGLVGVGVFIYFYKTLLSIVLASVFALTIVAVDLIFIKSIKKMCAKENQKYITHLENLNTQIQEVLQKVTVLTKTKQTNGDNKTYDREV